MQPTNAKSTTQTRIFTSDVKRLNAMKAQLQPHYPYTLTHPFLIMMMLNEREGGKPQGQGVQGG
jgi:hypothetical protein